MIPLLECPFCGGKGLLVSWRTVTYIQCQNPKCGAHVGVPGKDQDQKCIAKWNRRAGQ